VGIKDLLKHLGGTDGRPEVIADILDYLRDERDRLDIVIEQLKALDATRGNRAPRKRGPKVRTR
jgi:hypothetical protein